MPNSGPSIPELPCETPDFMVGPRPACVEQGPVWLAKLLWSPPEWIGGVVLAVVVVVVGLAALSYRRHGIDDEVLEEMGFMAIVCVAAIAWTNLAGGLGLPYLLDVAVGGVGGVVTAKIALCGVGRVTSESAA